ncbi:hypothetical protein NK6_9904 [Bradyrhizobium diazoefficiens]|uniref:Uncharacterized protein n=1 Tax=Bradyrhizobium diazoefficiens TaxID=1355477 RepID=A0A0E4BYA2_9BRAD|nr:hypothetical protein NK6_9904 [Bradyrhizobium diazoefficiens]
MTKQNLPVLLARYCSTLGGRALPVFACMVWIGCSPAPCAQHE